MMNHSIFRRRYFEQNDHVTVADEKVFGRSQWIVGRSLCLYKYFVLTDYPEKQRLKALRIQIQQWSPWSQSGSYIVFNDTSAMVWIWNEGLRQEKASRNNGSKASAVPETLLQGKLSGEGLRVVKCIDGVDVQIWKDGFLHSSRWWLDVPDKKVLFPFVVTHELDPAQELPEPRKMEIMGRPWAKPIKESSFSDQQTFSKFIKIGYLLLGLCLVFQLSQLLKWHQYRNELQLSKDAILLEVNPVITAKAAAIENRLAIEKLRNLVPYPPQLALRATVVGILSRLKLRINEWRYTEGKLSLSVKGPKVSSQKLIRAFQKNEWFSNVRSEDKKRSNDILITMDVAKISL